MNEMMISRPRRDAATVEARFSPELRAAVDVHVPRYSDLVLARDISPPVPSGAVIREAKAALTALGPVECIGLADFTVWMEPFFRTAGGRAVTEIDRARQSAALWGFIQAMPAAVFTPEAQRRVAQATDFLPTAKVINDELGGMVRVVLARRRALERIAEAAPRSPDPAPKTAEELEAERADRKAHVARVMREHRAAMAAMAVEGVKGASSPSTPRHFTPDELALSRRDNPLVQAALKAAAELAKAARDAEEAG